MTSYDLLNVIGEAREEYVFDAIKTKAAVPQRKKRRSLNRIGLIAAIITLFLLLAGCVAVFFHLQDMSIGKETYTESYNDQGLAIEPTEGIRDILTWGGHNGDPIQLALMEWDDFLKTYDTDGSLMANFLETETIDFPEQYYHTYNCYTNEMANKLEEISQKYNLKLLGTLMPIQRYQMELFWESTGLNSFLLPESDAETANVSGIVYAPSNFRMDFDLKLNSGELTLVTQYSYLSKEYLSNRPLEKMDFTRVSQWEYSTCDGTHTLLVLSDNGKAFILAEKDDATILIEIDGNLTTSHYPQPDDLITKNQLEEIADAFDYSIEPRPLDQAILKSQLEETEAAYQAAHTYAPERHESFAEHLINRPIRTGQFTFYDLTGDGEEELLLGKDGYYTGWLTIQNGQVIACSVNETYLCENGVQEEVESMAFSSYEKHTYLALNCDGPITASDLPVEIITCLTRKNQIWYQGPSRITLDAAPISDEQAQAVMAQYPRIALDWYPIGEFPIDAQGRTLSDYIPEQDDQPNDSELRQIYADLVREIKGQKYTHYLIADFNQDGMDDLWLSKDGKSIYDVFTYRSGETYGLAILDYYTCEGNVMESNDTIYMIGGVEKEEHAYYRYGADGLQPIAYVAYNKATASWECDRDGTPITESEAMSIIARYPRADIGLRPVQELMRG